MKKVRKLFRFSLQYAIKITLRNQWHIQSFFGQTSYILEFPIPSPLNLVPPDALKMHSLAVPILRFLCKTFSNFFLGARVWVPKPVYQAPKWPGCVTGNISSNSWSLSGKTIICLMILIKHGPFKEISVKFYLSQILPVEGHSH